MTNSVTVRNGVYKSDEYGKCFPPFLWLVRDNILQPTDKYGMEITPTKFITTVVLKDDDDDDFFFDSTIRNTKMTIRKTLTQCFPTFECKTLRPPSHDPKVLRKISTSMEKLDSSFNKEVDELIAFVKANIKEKKVFDAAGAKCNGPIFVILVKEVSKAVNNPHSIPALDSIWKLVVESRCRSVQERLLSEYCNSIKDRYDETSKGGPIEEVADYHELEYKKSLMEIHLALWSELRKKLYDELGSLLILKVTGECTLETVTDQLEEQLIQTRWQTDPSTQAIVKKVVGGALLPIAEENRKRSWKFCDQLITELYTSIREKVQTTDSEDGYTPDKLAADIKALLQEYDAKSVGPEKWKVRAAMESTINHTKEFFQIHLHKVLQYAKQKREAKEVYEKLQNELRELKASKKQIERNFDDFKVRAEKEIQKLQQIIQDLKKP